MVVLFAVALIITTFNACSVVYTAHKHDEERTCVLLRYKLPPASAALLTFVFIIIIYSCVFL